MKFKLTPIQECVLFLIILSLAAVGVNLKAQSIDVFGLHLLSTVGIGLIWFFILKKITKQPRNAWDTVITGLILFLVLHYTNPEAKSMPLIAGLISILAVSSKFLLHYKGMPILNPAVTGLLGGVLIAQIVPSLETPFISWWGTDFQGYLSLALVAVWIVWGLKKWRKYNALLAFLAAHLILLLARGEGMEFIQYTFNHSTIFFLGSIMLIEPKTSPMMKGQQVAYGVIAAIVYNLCVQFGLSYGELIAILVANLFNLGLRVRMMMKAKPA